MDVEPLGEGLLQGGNVGDMGEDAQLDLAVVGRDQLHALRRDEGAPDLAALLGADRDVLQVRLRRREPPGGRRGQRVGGVHAAGRRIDEAWQRVGVGGFQLGDLPPLEHPRRQLMALGGEILEHARRGRPGAGRRLLAARQAHLAEQNVAELLRRAGVERPADNPADLVLEPAHALGEIAGEPREHVAVDRDAAPLHPRQHRNQRPLQRLVDRHRMLGDQPGLERPPKPQRDIGLFGGVFGRPVERGPREADEIAPGAGDVGEGGQLLSEDALGEAMHVMALAGRARIERVGHQHRVVDRRRRHAAAGEDMQVELDVLADLDDPRRLHQRLEQRQRLALGDLVRQQAGAVEQVVGSVAVADRHIGRFAFGKRERQADEVGLQRIRRRGLDIEGDEALVEGALDPGFDLVRAAEKAVGRSVDRRLRFEEPLRREIGGRRRAGGR